LQMTGFTRQSWQQSPIKSPCATWLAAADCATTSS
jgi:hypothetical protein